MRFLFGMSDINC